MSTERLRGLKQPDQRSCGPSSLVAAHMLIDPAYHPVSFADDVLALHRTITAPTAFGRAQLPWPRALGTPPWAVARTMSELTGVHHRTHLVRWGDRDDDLIRLAGAGHPCPLYIGDRRLPRHVVLVVTAAAETLQVYNPAHGTLVDVARAEFLAGHLTTTGGWDTPWFVVTPRPRARRTPA
jgi:hypothetical protein